ncbi:MAG: M28 family peptidase [Bacteroidetes bacterium]|nr:M28 family peptidase [Bacteroidota bacterium]
MRCFFPAVVIICIFFIFLSEGCKRKKPVKPVEKPKIEVIVPVFNADSAFEYIKQQLSFGPRVPGTPSHEQCAAFLVRQLKSFTPEVIIQTGKVRTFNGKELNIKNIIASFNPDSQGRILLAAHWDSRPWSDHDPDPGKQRLPVPAANDGGSGVGVLVEIARQMSIAKPRIGVDILLLDAEDYGPPDQESNAGDNEAWALGAQYWSLNPHKTGYHARFGILLDMVGAANARFPMEGYSVDYAPDILKKVWGKAQDLGFQNDFPMEEGATINDDHYFINKNLRIPTIDIIHLDTASSNGSFFEQWHTTHDDINVIDKYTLTVVGQTLLKVIYEE